MVKTGKGDSLREKRAQTGLLGVLSNLALDAPLVAVSWNLLFATGFGYPVDWRIPLSMFPVVWAIYLFDRLFDTISCSTENPCRKEFALRSPRLLKVLLLIATVWAVSTAFLLPAKIWIQGGVIGAVTLGYFLVFRWKNRSNRFPMKETLIGLCFAAGVGLPYETPVNWIKLLALLTFGIIGCLNCLIISRSEADYDLEADPSAWFSKPGRTFPFSFVFGVCLVAIFVLIFFGLPLVPAVSLLVANLLLFLLTFLPGKRIQPISDAALWLPGICGLLWQWSLTTSGS